MIERAPPGEWTIMPRPICKVTGTEFHETCVMGNDRTEYPCCGITYVIKDRYA